MKKSKWRYVIYLFCICSLFPCLLSSCKYDDSELIDRVDNLEDRLAKLEEQCKQINANINSLQTIVSALENANQITSVSELVENGKKVGYKIEFTKSGVIHIYHGQDRSDGSDRTGGYVPQIGVEKDKDGIYYWTLDGSWLTDKDGNKIKAVGLDGKDGQEGSDGSNGSNGSNGRDGITPKLQINSNGYWEVSYDNGKTWVEVGPATGGTAECPIEKVEIKDKYVFFTLSTGEEFKVPLFNGITITFGETTIGMEADSKVDLQYELTGSKDVKVSAIGEGVRTSVNQATNTLTITTDANFEGGKVLVHATDGNHVATVELTITKEVITYIEYEATEEISPFKSDGTPIFGGKDVSFFKDKSTFSEGKGKWAYTGEVTYVSAFAFTKNKTLKSITLPESINDIGYSAYGQGGSAFEDCTALESIVIKGNITTIRVRTFYGCSSLKSITLPESLTIIEYNAFLRCEALTEIVIPDAVTTIEKQVFSFCTSLTTATIGSSVTTIGNSCFNECDKLATIICKGENPPALGSKALMKDDAWTSTKYIKNIYVPVNAVDTYKRTNGWNEFSDRISAITE